MKRRKMLSLILAALVLFLAAVPGNVPVYAASQAENEKTCYEYFTEEMGLNTAAACGILANLYRESKFSPTASSATGKCYGIAQWTGGRLDNLKSYCKDEGYDYKTLKGQLHFLEYEINQSSRKSILTYMQGVKNTASGAFDAGYYWCYNFERPVNKASTSSARGTLARDTYWPKYASNKTSGSTKAKATATPTPKPVSLKITSQPSDQTVEADKLHKFIVEVSKSSGNSYQWQVKESSDSSWRDFTEKKTAKTKQLYFTVTSNMDGWQFRCIVKNGSASVTSDAFTVRIKGKAKAAATPTPKPAAKSSALKITSQPSDMTIKAGELYKFIVEVNKEDGASYQWQVKESSGSSWRDFTEKKTAKKKQLYFTVTEDMHNWQFRCVVKNGGDSVTSDAFTVKIKGKSSGSTLAVISQPSDQTVKADELHKFIMEVNKADGAVYQWQVKESSGSSWRDFTEKKTAKKQQLYFTVTSKMNGWQFRCVVKNGGESVTSDPFTVKTK